eukprot:5915482-Karenia_brevis.AAC.1
MGTIADLCSTPRILSISMIILASPIQSIQMCGCAWSAGAMMFQMTALKEIGLLVGMQQKLNQFLPFLTNMSSEHFVMRAGGSWRTFSGP